MFAGLACMCHQMAGWVSSLVQDLLEQATQWMSSSSSSSRVPRQQSCTTHDKYWELGQCIASLVINILPCVQHCQRVPYSGRLQCVLPGESAIRAETGLRDFLKEVASARSSGTLLPPDHPTVMMVRRVVVAVVAAVTKGLGDDAAVVERLRKLEWELQVVQDGGSSDRTMLVAPGGKVVVYTSLLHGRGGRADYEALLMSKVAHEVAAHVLAQHEAERDTLQRCADSLLKAMGLHWPVRCLVVNPVLSWALSRYQHYEADTMAKHIIREASILQAAR